MNSTTDARRNTPAGLPASTRELLRQTRDQISAAEDSLVTHRSEQSDHLTIALTNGATVREIVEASGVSRAYLHRAGVPLYAGNGPSTRSIDRTTEPAERATQRTDALTKSSELRDRVSQLKAELAEAKAQRVDQVTQLLTLGLDQPTITGDAGVSAEWIRRISKRHQSGSNNG